MKDRLEEFLSDVLDGFFEILPQIIFLCVAIFMIVMSIMLAVRWFVLPVLDERDRQRESRSEVTIEETTDSMTGRMTETNIVFIPSLNA